MDILGEICEHIDRLVAKPRAGVLPGPHAVPLIWASTAQLVAQAAARLNVSTVEALCAVFGVADYHGLIAQAYGDRGPIVYHGTTPAAARQIAAQGFSLAHLGERTKNFGFIGAAVYGSSLLWGLTAGSAVVEMEIRCPIFAWDHLSCRAARYGTLWHGSDLVSWIKGMNDRAAAEQIAKRLRWRRVYAARVRYLIMQEIAIYDPRAIVVRAVRDAASYGPAGAAVALPDDAPPIVHIVDALHTNRASLIHGDEHARRVAQFAMTLARETPGARALIVWLFGLIHDAQRVSDGADPDHGRRAAQLVRRLRADGALQLADNDAARLIEACAGHTDGQTSRDPTIGCCWDADRLDLWRLARPPDPRLLSTDAARGRIEWARTTRTAPDWAALYADLPDR